MDADNKDIEPTLENFEKLAKKYSPLFKSTASLTMNQHHHDARIEYDDLMQCGLFALYKAIENFNPARNVFFGSYLKLLVGNEMKTYARHFLPHHFVKDNEKTKEQGKDIFKRLFIQVGHLDESYDGRISDAKKQTKSRGGM